LLRFSNSTPNTEFYKDDVTAEAIPINPSFYGVESKQEADELLEHGYDKTVKRLKSDLLRDVKTLPKDKTGFASGPVGFAPIVPNAILGLPNSMVMTKREPVKSKIIDLMYFHNYNCKIRKGPIEDGGSKVLRLVQSLEAEGYRIRLSVAFGAESRGFSGMIGSSYKDKGYSEAIQCVAIKVKDEGQPLDIKRCAFLLTHPATERVYIFEWMHKTPEPTIENMGLGYPIRRNSNSWEFCHELFKTDMSKQVVIDWETAYNNPVEYLSKLAKG
jgi:hypothetical protein